MYYTRTTPDRGGQGKRDPGRQGRKTRMQHALRRSPLLMAVCLFAALLVAPAANAASVTPRVVDKNPSCESLGYTEITRFDPVKDGTSTQAGVTISNADVDGGTFD